MTISKEVQAILDANPDRAPAEIACAAGYYLEAALIRARAEYPADVAMLLQRALLLLADFLDRGADLMPDDEVH